MHAEFDYTKGMTSTVYYWAWAIGTVWAILYLLRTKREPAATLAWIFFVTVAPLFGPLFLFFFGPQRLERAAVRRRAGMPKREIGRTPLSPPYSAAPPPRAALPVLELVQEMSGYPITAGNRVEILTDPSQALQNMMAAIDAARDFIHLEYYIIASDEVTVQLFDGLSRAIDRGVEVRILYDALGSLSLKRWYFRNLLRKGAKVAGFLPLSSITKRFNLNFRNHRKILVIDGQVSFTGSANIGREYLGRRRESQFRDIVVRVEGPVIQQLEDVFAKDWYFTTKEELFDSRYYPAVEPRGDTWIQILDSGPDSPFYKLHQALFLAITLAERQVLLTTPYFVPDFAINSALEVASRRGVDVTLLLPRRLDYPIVKYAARSFYDSLLRANVRIFEYQPRILHTKLLIVDDKWTVLGSFNMDIRSFRLNFELSLFAYGPSLNEQACRLFETDLGDSLEIDPEKFRKRPVPQQMLENACRLLSPVL